MNRLTRWTSPTSAVYLLANSVVFLFGFIVARLPGTLSAGVGSSLVAAGVTGWVIFVYIRLSEDRARIVEVVSRFGLVDVFEGRGVRIKSEYGDRLTKAHGQIDIMGFGLKSLREDYSDHFLAWSARAHVRILLIDPAFPNVECSHARQRDSEEGDTAGAIENDIEQFKLKIKELGIRGNNRRFEVRLYKCLPSVNIFRVDDDLFWGPYLIRLQSRNAPTLLVRRGGLLFDHFIKHFDCIWNDDNLSGPLHL